MKKGLSLFKSYFILLFTTTFLGVMLLSWFQTCYLMNSPERYLPGLKITMSITTGLIFMIALAVFIVTRPFQRIISRFEKTGETPNEEEEKIIIDTYPKMNKVSIIGVIIGFILGNGGTVLVKYILGKYDGSLIHVTIAMIQACIYAGFVSTFIIYMTDSFFAKFREILHIHNLDKFKKGWNVAKTLRVAVVVCFLFNISNIMMVAFASFSEVANQNASNYATQIILATIETLIPTCFIILIMLTSLNSRISTAEKHIKKVAEGTATELIDITNMDDFGMLAGSVNGLAEKLQSLVKRIHHETQTITEVSKTLDQVTDEVNTALESVSNSYNRISEESDKQKEEIASTEQDVTSLTNSVKNVEKKVLEHSSVIQESSAAITEMAENINSLAGMASKADTVSKQLSRICSESSDSLKNATAAIEEINSSTKAIVEIVKAMQKISSQTNILSMNAAIEAAHAGKFGAGFAVVADEVRSLATSSSKSAKDIEIKIKDMTNRVNAGVAAMGIIGNAFQKIEEAVEQNAEISSNITQALREQQSGTENNMRATQQAAEDTNKVKELVTSQHEFTESVNSSMKIVVDSTDAMKNAISAGVDATQTMQAVVARIDETVKSNGVIVGELKKIIEEFDNAEEN